MSHAAIIIINVHIVQIKIVFYSGKNFSVCLSPGDCVCVPGNSVLVISLMVDLAKKCLWDTQPLTISGRT